MFKKILETVEVYRNLLCPKTLDAQGFTPSGGGALRQLSSWEAKQLGNLRKEESKLVSKEELCHVEVLAETSQNSCNSKIMRFFGLRPQNDKSYNVTNLLTYSPINLFTKRRVAFTLAEGATHVDISHNCRRIAFTLAEVLITLGIIGVVAALTLPTLIQNHQKQTYVTQLKKFMSTFEQSLQMAMADDGVDDLRNTDLFKDGFYGHKGEVENQQFVSKFKKYLKIEIKNVSDEQASTFTCGAFSEYFFIPDGVIVTNFTGGGLINDSANCATIKNFGGHMCAEVASLQVDVNGFKGPNVLGRDRFYFAINERGRLVSYGSRDYSLYYLLDERFMWDKTSDNARKCDANGGGGCAARIIDEGWKMNY